MRAATVLRTLFFTVYGAVALYFGSLYIRSVAADTNPWQIWGELALAVTVPFVWTLMNRRFSERLRIADARAWKRWGKLGDLIQTATIASLAGLTFVDKMAGPHVLMGLCVGALAPRYVVRLPVLRGTALAGSWSETSEATAG